MQAPNRNPGRYYRPELDVVRFIAFFLVFLVHSLPSTHDPRVAHLLKGFGPVFDAIGDACGFGLNLFFTLSAFLICELLLRERESAGDVAVKQFYIRRILRIWPLYYLGIILGALAAFLPGEDPAAVIHMGWYAAFLGAWYCVFYGGLHNPMTVLWSVSIEEQFYLFAPWTIKYLNRKWLYGFCLAIILIANLCLFYLGRVRAPHYSVWCNTFVQFECFAGGILLCLALHGRLPRLAAWQRLVLLACCFLCWFYSCYGLHAFFGATGGRNPGSWPLIAGWALVTLGCVLLIVAFMGVRAALLPNWAIYLGRISYGLYVYHLFAISLMNHLIIRRVADLNDPALNVFKGPIYLLNLFLCLGLTILMAAVSYRFFETPFLKMKRRHTVIESQPIAG
jgi:peptidoglycan/LPS O-acetylase OafA/YrhL